MRIRSRVQGTGVEISHVAPDTPAAVAGLEPGDIFVEIGARCLLNAPYDFVLAQLTEARHVTLVVMREIKSIGQNGAVPAASSDLARIVQLHPSSTGLGLKIASDDQHFGMYIAGMQPHSPAAATPLLRVGDVIVEINGTYVANKHLEDVLHLLRVPAVTLALLEARDYNELQAVAIDSGTGSAASNIVSRPLSLLPGRAQKDERHSIQLSDMHSPVVADSSHVGESLA